MKVPLLDLKPQFAALRDELMHAVGEVCESQIFILGPKVEAFEAHVAEYCGAAAAVGVSSGTDALLVSLMAAGVGQGDLVLTTPYTFFATAGSVIRAGAIPCFVDIDPETYNMNPDLLEAAIEDARRRHPDHTLKAIMPVHLYGQVAQMQPILDVAARHNLMVFEDACQAIGSEYRLGDRVVKAGAMGLTGSFSFFPSKNLGGFGDGGMVITQDADFAERLKQFRNHGSKPKYFHPEVGGNFRLDALQAAVLDVKLNALDQWHMARRENAARYDAAFEDLPVTRPTRAYAADTLTFDHIYNQYIIRVAERDRVRAALTEAGIGCEVYYPVPLDRQACFEHLGYIEGTFPESERAARETLALPIYPDLTAEQQDAVVEALHDALGA